MPIRCTMSNLNTGDVVVLKSGGPRMTVTQTGLPKRHVVCTWLDDAKNQQDGTFSLDALTLASSEPHSG